MSENSDNQALDSIDVMQIMNLLPHRYPFLLVDKIIDIDGDKSAIGIKNVTINEPFFQGHFPGHPVMPGVLIVEAMAQVSGAICAHAQGVKETPDVVYFMSIDKCKFRKPVTPGDVLHIHVTQTRHRGNIWKFACQAKVEGKLVCEAEIGAMMAPNS
ncbi:MAG: 3-hydroxyacyl-[acyl-carrier-protein] dehydratase FabZ [Hyphomicrobiales bacterium]|nr:MAG: 3-hydroxyacyl-[acyl-carrier-protein] dehydratase FabZ [Hyphomicrobiales bacterium]